jgi:hypothetical protein
MIGETVVNTNMNYRGNEIRQVSLEKIAALPTSPLVQGQILQVGAKIYYGDTASSWKQLVTLQDLTAKPRHVGGLNLSTGTISLVTPNADTDSTTNWNIGDFGIVVTGGVLSPAPGGGNKTVQPGDMVFMVANTAATNADFIIIESNQAQPASLTPNFADILTTDWTGAAGAWTCTKTTTVSNNIPFGVAIINSSNNQIELFDVELTASTVKINSSNVVKPSATYKIRAGI